MVGLCAMLPLGVSELRAMSHCGRDLLCVIPLTRWDVEQAALDLVGSSPEVASRVRHGGFLCDAELLEHGFFGVSAAEAASMAEEQASIAAAQARKANAQMESVRREMETVQAAMAQSEAAWQAKLDRATAQASGRVQVSLAASLLCLPSLPPFSASLL